MVSDAKVIRVMIADAQPGFRKALRTFLEPESDLKVVGEASDADGVFALAGKLKPDVLFVEYAFLGSLKSRAGCLEGMSALVTVPAADRTNIIRAFLQGAKAVVPKPSAPQIWRDSIRTVLAGQYWLGEEGTAILVLALRDYFSRKAETKSPNDYKLTPREVEIISKIANGHSNKEVGQAFSIRERTVKHHLTNIFTKVGVSSRLELALFAVNQLLLEAPSLREAISLDEPD